MHAQSCIINSPCEITKSETLRVIKNPTYEEQYENQRTLINSQPTELSSSTHYSTLGPAYEPLTTTNLRTVMLPGTSDGNHRPQRHTEPAKYTCTYETLSNKRNTHINWQEVLPTDTHGYSRLQH